MLGNSFRVDGIASQFFFVLGIYSCGLVFFLRGLLPADQVSPTLQTFDGIHGTYPPTQQIQRFVFMVVDGLRTDLLFSPRYSHFWSNTWKHTESKLSTKSKSIIQPPTVTMPRIKAMTSGRVPKFLDILQNLNADVIAENNWLSQSILRNKWNVEFYGDDTWIKLFPNAFKRSDGTNSFFVNDFHEVDVNVTRHLNSIFERASWDWNGLILHYLGLDHIGHVEGPNGSNVPAKLREMDTVVDRILTAMSTKDEPWIFILTGDHGMADQGGHGGSSHPEISTGLLMISSQPRMMANQLETIAPENVTTEQVDLASFMGLITGSGIPSSSMGIIPFEWLQKFWFDSRSKLSSLMQLMAHFADLLDCPIKSSTTLVGQIALSSGCGSNQINSSEISSFNEISEHLAKHLRTLSQTSDRSDPLDMGDDIKSAVELLGTLQSRILIGTDHLGVAQMIIGGLVMWIVTAFLVISVVFHLWSKEHSWNSSYLEPIQNITNETLNLLDLRAAKLLCAFASLCLLIQTFSLGSSSFAEEEHQFWYYFSTSLFVLCGAFICLGQSGIAWRGNKLSGLGVILGITLLDRVLLCQLHRTGDKWIHLPDLSDWLYRQEHQFWMWVAQVIIWILWLMLRWAAIDSCNPFTPSSVCIRLMRFGPLFSTIFLALSQMCYRIFSALGIAESSVFWARMTYILLFMDVVIAYRWRQLNISADRSSSTKVDKVWSDLLHPINTVPLLVTLLGRPAIGLLWTGIFMKEALVARLIRMFWDHCQWTHDQSLKLHLSCCWLFYWIQGWTSFFQQGNSLSLATIDVSAAYVGLRTHQPLIAGLLLVVYTYAGPLYWQLAYMARFALPKKVDHEVARSLAYIRLGFAFLPVTFAATICFILQSHLFIWTVFTPKLLYLAMFHVSFIPLLFAWGALHA